MALLIEWSEAALASLEEVAEFLVRTVERRATRKILNKITRRVQLLAKHPKIGQREELLEDRPDEYRYLVVGNYKIIYRVASEKIVITFVFDCRRHPEKLKRGVRG